MLDSAIDYIRLGFHGFAFVMLFLGYMLLRSFVTKCQTMANDLKQEQSDLFRMLSRNIIGFLVISLIFFVGGASLEIFRQAQLNSALSQPHDLEFLVSPAMMPSGLPPPKISLRDVTKEFDMAGRATLQAKNEDSIRVLLEDVTNKYTELDNLNRQLLGQWAEDEDGGGFNDDSQLP